MKTELLTMTTLSSSGRRVLRQTMNDLKNSSLVVTNRKPQQHTLCSKLIEQFSFSISVLADNRTEMIRVFTTYMLPGFMYAVFKDI